MARPKVGSVCSGVGGMDLGFERAGFITRWVCEADPFRRNLLAKHFPTAKQYPDLATIDPVGLEPVAVLIGGTPCQDLSNAGLHAGLDGERSGLFWDYMRVRNGLNVPWCVWENVAGAFSSNGGLDFASVLGAFVGATVHVPAGGWGSAGVVTGPWGGAVWRLLDAQYFGVPQRRKRVFVVGHLGGPCPPEVLFEPKGSDGDFAESGAKGEETASTFGIRVAATLGAKHGGGLDPTDFERNGAYVQTAHALTTSAQRYGDGSEETFAVGTALDADRTRTVDGLAGRLDGALELAASLTKGSAASPGVNSPGRRQEDDVNLALADQARGRDSCALDPRPDGRRDSATGDGVVAPVAEWVGRRLLAHL